MFFGLMEALFGLGLRHNEQPSSLKTDMPQEMNNTTLVPPQFRDDVESLKSFVGNENWKPGLEIKLELKDLLALCPRERRRSDAYKKLIAYLKDDCQIQLIIKSKRNDN